MKLPRNKLIKLKLKTKLLEKPPKLKLKRGKQNWKPLGKWLKRKPRPKLKPKRKPELLLKRRSLQSWKL